MATNTEPQWYRDQQRALMFQDQMKNTQVYKDFLHKSFFHDEKELENPPSNDSAIESPKIVMGEHQLRYIYSQLEHAWEASGEEISQNSHEQLEIHIDNARIELLKVYKQNNLEP